MRRSSSSQERYTDCVLTERAGLQHSALTLVAAILAFGVVSVSSLVSIHRQAQDAQWVTHTYEVLAQIETTMRFATEARGVGICRDR